MQVTYSYDAASRLTQLKNQYSNGEILSQFDYAHNPSGSISQIRRQFKRPLQNTIGDETVNYTYDNSDRLTGASNEATFVYDELGNMLQNSGQFNALNQLLEDDSFIYSYSLNGNLLTKTSKLNGKVTTYTWDGLNRIIGVLVKKGSETLLVANYSYDPLGRRSKKVVNGEVTYFVYDGEDILAELNENFAPKAYYLHGPGIDDPIAMVRDVNNNGSFESTEVFVFTKDHLGSVREISDLQQNPIQRYNYSAYGRTRIEKLNANSEKLVVNPYAYTSRELDESGDYFYRARYYDAWNGRFLSLDPIGFAGGDESLYRYVGNDPVQYVDPYGYIKWRQLITGGFFTVAGGAIVWISVVTPAPLPAKGLGVIAGAGITGIGLILVMDALISDAQGAEQRTTYPVSYQGPSGSMKTPTLPQPPDPTPWYPTPHTSSQKNSCEI